MDFRSQAIGIVESAFYESFPDVRLRNIPLEDFSDWAEQPLGKLFPAPDQFLNFLERVSTAIQAIRLQAPEVSDPPTVDEVPIFSPGRRFTAEEKFYLSSITAEQFADVVVLSRSKLSATQVHGL